MRLFLAYWNELCMYRATWHRKQHAALMASVRRYLDQVGGR